MLLKGKIDSFIISFSQPHEAIAIHLLNPYRGYINRRLQARIQVPRCEEF